MPAKETGTGIVFGAAVVSTMPECVNSCVECFKRGVRCSRCWSSYCWLLQEKEIDVNGEFLSGFGSKLI